MGRFGAPDALATPQKEEAEQEKEEEEEEDQPSSALAVPRQRPRSAPDPTQIAPRLSTTPPWDTVRPL